MRLDDHFGSSSTVQRNERVKLAASFWNNVGASMVFGGMAAAFFLYAASGLVAPWWGLTILLFVWLVLFVTACRWWTPHPGRLPLLAVAAVVFWFLAVSAGGAWLGWTA